MEVAAWELLEPIVAAEDRTASSAETRASCLAEFRQPSRKEKAYARLMGAGRLTKPPPAFCAGRRTRETELEPISGCARLMKVTLHASDTSTFWPSVDDPERGGGMTPFTCSASATTRRVHPPESQERMTVDLGQSRFPCV